MSVIVVGLSYRGAPVDLLERFAFDHEDLPKALAHARANGAVREAVILSTCNRTEVYAAVNGFHAGLSALRQFLSEYHGVPLEDFRERLYGLYSDQAVTHLFGVSAGIDSMVLGEPQILAQMRRAFHVATEEGSTGQILSALFRHAIRVGRRVRSETDIARSGATLALASAAVASEALGDLAGRTTLVVGAGEMSDLAASVLARKGMRILIANRTLSRAQVLAKACGGEALSLDNLARALGEADFVIASTGSPDPVITHDMVAAAMATRPARPLVLVDTAVPRDIEPLVATVPGVTLRDMDDLREAVAPDREQLFEVERVRAIVGEEVARYAAWRRSQALAPLISSLQSHGERVRAAEIRRAQGALAGLGDREREAVEVLTRAIVAKLLHHPMSALKERAGTSEGDALARALRTLHALQEGES